MTAIRLEVTNSSFQEWQHHKPKCSIHSPTTLFLWLMEMWPLKFKLKIFLPWGTKKKTTFILKSFWLCPCYRKLNKPSNYLLLCFTDNRIPMAVIEFHLGCGLTCYSELIYVVTEQIQLQWSKILFYSYFMPRSCQQVLLGLALDWGNTHYSTIWHNFSCRYIWDFRSLGSAIFKILISVFVIPVVNLKYTCKHRDCNSILKFLTGNP